MKKMQSIFMSGLKVVAPILVTVLLLYWTFIGFERIFKWFALLVIDPDNYFSGLGWILALLLTGALGLIVQIPFFQRAANHLTDQFLRLPVIRTLYRMSSDIMNFATKKGVKKGTVVKMDTPCGKVVGIMTQDKIDQLPDGIGGKDEVAVFVPMSYQIGGFTFIVPKKSVEPLDVSVQKGIALTMSAYISGKDQT